MPRRPGAMLRLLPGRFLSNRPCSPSLCMRASQSSPRNGPSPHVSGDPAYCTTPFTTGSIKHHCLACPPSFCSEDSPAVSGPDPRHEAIPGWNFPDLLLFPIWQHHLDIIIRIIYAFQTTSCAGPTMQMCLQPGYAPRIKIVLVVGFQWPPLRSLSNIDSSVGCFVTFFLTSSSVGSASSRGPQSPTKARSP